MADLFGFTAEQTRRITGLSLRQLHYWDATGFFSPGETMKSKFPGLRLYTFRNLVGLRALAILRNIHHVPLQELRKVGAGLAKRHQTPWASLTLYISGKTVFFEDPESGAITAVRPPGQTAFKVEMTKIANETQAAVEGLRRRADDDIGAIKKKRNIVHNQPVLSGTRIPTSAIWNLNEAGFTDDEIVREYPRLTKVDIESALAFERNERLKAG